MKPRYATSSGKPPTYLASIDRGQGDCGDLVFFGDSGARTVPFSSEAVLLATLQRLMSEAVPISVGGHTLGPADEVAMLTEAGKLSGPYVQISWANPKQWMVREISKGAVEWQQVSAPDLIANCVFNADAMERAG